MGGTRHQKNKDEEGLSVNDCSQANPHKTAQTTPLNLRLTTPSHDIRKTIARTLTIINTTQRQQLRLFYKNKKYSPLDLRPKQTRAIRRRLSPEEKKVVTEKMKKKLSHFPQRRFAVRAA